MNIIYCLCHKYYTYSEKLNKLGIKIGSTCNIISRCKTYRTGYVDSVPLICYYKVSKNCYIIDNNLKKHFDGIRFKNTGGGIEFYDANKLTFKEECYKARDKCIEIVKEKYDNKYKKININNKYKLINEIDSKIPLQDLEYYYL